MSGKVVHFEIPCDDAKRAGDFYREAFGWNIKPMPDMDYTIVTTTATDEHGMPTEPGAINGGLARRQGERSKAVIVIDVPDIEAALDTVQKLGGRTVEGRMPIGDMGFAGYFEDTEGNVVGLWETAK